MDEATGKVIFEDNADKQGYPASMVKLMDLLIVLEKVKKGAITLEDKVTISAEVALIGGSQVYLKQGEVFSINELIFAMVIQSGNDAATALANHIAGSKAAFVQMMNAKAQELGMKSTRFASVHGLPPSRGEDPDITTARDMALLCLELVRKYPEALQYTSTRERTFRTNPLFIMRTHNHLLTNVEGCDGLKTGYFRLAGFSISATASRNGRRVVGVVMGSKQSKVRDAKATELLTAAFMNLPPLPPPPPPPVITNTVDKTKEKADVKKSSGKTSKTRKAIYIGLAIAAVLASIRLFRVASITRY